MCRLHRSFRLDKTLLAQNLLPWSYRLITGGLYRVSLLEQGYGLALFLSLWRVYVIIPVAKL